MPVHETAALFRVRTALPNVAPNYNLAPSQQAPVIRRHPGTGERHLDLLVWGLVPHWTTDIAGAPRPINARAEGVATSRMFRGALHARRAIVPADAFYEWKPDPAGKQPYAVARADGAPLAFAGLWESFTHPNGDILRSFVIITTDAGPDVAALHHRMPVILEPEAWPLWLGEAAGDPLALLRPSAAGTLRAWPVGRAVNRVTANGPDLLAPLAEPLPAGSSGQDQA